MNKKLIIGVTSGVVVAVILGLVTKGIVDNKVPSKNKEYVEQLNKFIEDNNLEDKTIHTIYTTLKDNNLDIDKVELSKKQQLVYNKDLNKFMILNKFNGSVYPSNTDYGLTNELWKIVHSEKELNTNFSSYLADDFKESGDNVLNIKSGIDLGNNTINKIVFSDTKDLGKVYFYGKLNEIEIDKNAKTKEFYKNDELIK